MEAIFNVILPVFALIASGYLAAKFRILSGDSTDALNKFVFFIAMPVLLFHVVATLNPAEIFNWTFIGSFMAANSIVLLLSIFVSMVFFRRDLADSGLFAMASTIGNSVYMGIPLSVIAYGDSALIPAIVAAIFQSVCFIIPVVVLLELGVNKGVGGIGIVTKLVRSLSKNPIMMAPLVGLAWALTGWSLPVPVDTFAKILGAAAGPCALFAIGLFLYGKPIHEGVREVGSMVVIKLLVQPLVAYILLFHVFEIEPMFAKVGLLLAALPTGANSFVLAQQYGRFVQRASTAVLISTVVAVVTLSVLLNLEIMSID